MDFLKKIYLIDYKTENTKLKILYLQISSIKIYIDIKKCNRTNIISYDKSGI